MIVTDAVLVKLGLIEPILVGLRSGQIHNGGRIAFAADRSLYVGTGDTGVPTLAADPTLRGVFRTLSQSLEGVRLGKAKLEDLKPALAALAAG